MALEREVRFRRTNLMSRLFGWGCLDSRSSASVVCRMTFCRLQFYSLCHRRALLDGIIDFSRKLSFARATAFTARRLNYAALLLSLFCLSVSVHTLKLQNDPALQPARFDSSENIDENPSSKSRRKKRQYSFLQDSSPVDKSRLDSPVNGALHPFAVPLIQVTPNHYAVDIQLGSSEPPQRLLLLPDSGSPTFCVVSASCQEGGCRSVRRFDPSESHTFRDFHFNDTRRGAGEVVIQFGSGAVKGRMGADRVGLTVYNLSQSHSEDSEGLAFNRRSPEESTVRVISHYQPFLLIESLIEPEGQKGPESLFGRIGFEGLLGLGRPRLLASGASSIWSEQVHSITFLLRPKFLPDGNENDVEFGSQAMMLFNADASLDKIYQRALDDGKVRSDTFAVMGDEHWETALDFVYYGEEKLCCDRRPMQSQEDGLSSPSPPGRVVFDSGSSAIAVPPAVFETLVSKYSVNLFPCAAAKDNLRDFTFGLDGRNLTVRAELLLNHGENPLANAPTLLVEAEGVNAEASPAEICRVNIMPVDNGERFIAGTPFFQEHVVSLANRPSPHIKILTLLPDG